MLVFRSNFNFKNISIVPTSDQQMATKDELFLQLLELCDEYMKLKMELNDCISKGIFSLAQSKKNHTINLDNMRFEIEPNTTIVMSNAVVNNINDGNNHQANNHVHTEICSHFESVDDNPLLLLSAMPSPALKRSQQHFVKSLDALPLLASITNKIIGLIETLQQSN